MAQATAGNDNQLDDLFDYDVDTEIPDLNIDLNPLKRRPEKSSSSRKIDLGIDEEIKIKRVRRPPVKLDAERLLSPKGLPQLRRTAPELLGKRLKGKGHEYKDAARILRFYQLWADDLYPKANFKDTMSIIEKLGHTKRVQIARHQYLDEYRPQTAPSEAEMETREVHQAEEERAPGGGGGGGGDEDEDEDLYEPGPRAPVIGSMAQESNGGSLFLGGDDDDSENEEVGAQPHDTELEMLLQADATERAEPVSGTAKGKEISSAVDEVFDDDLEAMDDWDEAMDQASKADEAESIKSQGHGPRLGTPSRTPIFDGEMGGEKPGGASIAPHDDVDDEDALEAIYGF